MLSNLRSIQRRVTVGLSAVLVAFGMTLPGSAAAEEIDWGKVGDPVNLVVGYQP